MSISISLKSQIISTKQEYRCPQCSLVPFIEIISNENKLIMSTKCINNHIYSETFDKMRNLCKSSPISNSTCETCKNLNKNNNQKITKLFFYCSKCYKFFCMKHGNEHNLKEGHQIFINKKFDSICYTHDGTTVVGYCSNHNKNYCVLCEHFIENNNNIDEKLNKDKINFYEKEIQKNEELIKDLELLFNKYKETFKELDNNFDTYKQNIFKKIEFMKDIINFYQFKETESDINFQMKANIENNHFDINKTNQIVTKKINLQINEINDLIKLLQKNEVKEISY